MYEHIDACIKVPSLFLGDMFLYENVCFDSNFTVISCCRSSWQLINIGLFRYRRWNLVDSLRFN